MANEIIRMNRIRLMLKECPIEKKKIKRQIFVAKMSIRHGISARTIDDYMKTLIDAGEVALNIDNMIWRKE